MWSKFLLETTDYPPPTIPPAHVDFYSARYTRNTQPIPPPTMENVARLIPFLPLGKSATFSADQPSKCPRRGGGIFVHSSQSGLWYDASLGLSAKALAKAGKLPVPERSDRYRVKGLATTRNHFRLGILHHPHPLPPFLS